MEVGLWDLKEHLERYGIRHFEGEDYWEWARQELGEPLAKEADRLRSKVTRQCALKPEDVQRFYEFIADPKRAGVVHSMKADAIRASGSAVEERLKGRERILDLGCHLGYLTAWYALKDRERRVTGIDFSKRSIREARKKAGELGVGNVHFQVEEITRFMSEESFDAIVDTQTISSIEDRDSLFQRLYRFLTPEGVFLSIPALKSAREARRFLGSLRRPGFHVNTFEFIFYLDCGEPGAYPMITAGQFGEDCGIDIEEAYSGAFKEMITRE